MRPLAPYYFLLLAPGLLVAADPSDFDLIQRMRDQPTRNRLERQPEADLKKIVNDSNSFLKEREPEMTSEEYALYRKLTSMLTANPELAIKLLDGMMNQKEPPSPAFEFILGNAYYAAGENDKAEAHYRSGLEKYPTFLRAWNNLGILYYSAGRYADAVPCFSKSLELGDRDAATFGLLAYSLEKNGNTIGAEMAYMQAVAAAPDKLDWKEGLVRLYIETGQFGRAEALIRTLLKQRPKDGRYWMTYANVLLSQNKKLKAMAALEVASSGPEASGDELALLGDLYAEQQLIPEAIDAYERMASRQPAQGTRKQLRFAQVLIAGGKLEAALSLLQSVKPQENPELQAEVLQARADLCLAQKQWGGARREIEALLRIAPMNGRALLTLGRSYLAEENFDRAAFAFEAAYRIPATTYRASLELANLELRNRNYDKSISYLEKAYSFEKTDAIADLLVQVRVLAGKDM